MSWIYQIAGGPGVDLLLNTIVTISCCVWYKKSHKLYLPFSGPGEEEKAAHC